MVYLPGIKGLLVLGIVFLVWAQPVHSSRELTFLTWPDYMDPELVARFEQEHDVEVRTRYFESDDHRNDLLIASDGRGYDVIMLNDTEVAHYRQRGWLASLTEQEVPNLRHVDPRWRKAYPGTEGYAVPVLWGTFGIGYREDLVPEPIESWMQLFQPHETLRGRIVMIRQQRDLIGVALMALGYSANSSDAAELAAAQRLLMEQRPFVNAYGYISLSEASALVSGEIAAATMFNGDVLQLQEYDERIRYALPREGSFVWIDYLAVLASSPNQDLARAFVNFLNAPEHAARWAEHVYTATANQSATALLSEEFRADPIVWPDEDSMSQLEFLEPLPPRVARRWNAVFNEVVR
jgi:spermidine/putrescine transport system substrate-binding protein